MKKSGFVFILILTIPFFAGACTRQSDNDNTIMAGSSKTEASVIGGENMKHQATEMEVKMVADTLQISADQYDELRVSIDRLYEIGCNEIVSLEITKEEKGLKYFTVSDNAGKQFFADSNQHGSFGAVLSKEAYENAEILADTLKMEINRNVLYSAQTMESCQMGKIVSVDQIDDLGGAYICLLLSDSGLRYQLRISENGSLGEITTDSGEPVYVMYE